MADGAGIRADADLAMPFRRAVEALRSGVPNRDAARFLPTFQAKIESRFTSALQLLPTHLRDLQSADGFIIDGGFGAGKSHVLERLMQQALDSNVPCSKIVVSKEMPLGRLDKVYRSAARGIALPGRSGLGIAELLQKLDRNSPRYVAAYNFIASGAGEFHPLIVATLYLFHKAASDPAIQHDIFSFWSGEPLSHHVIRQWLREQGVKRAQWPPINSSQLAIQRFRFVSQLLRAAGYGGWLIVVDELELVAKYSVTSRAKALANLALLLGALRENPLPGILCIAAATDDLASELIATRHDDLAFAEISADDELRKMSRVGLVMIKPTSGRVESMTPITAVHIHEAYGRLREVYMRAYGCRLSAGRPRLVERSRTMRQYVRRWVTLWDMERLAPKAHAQIVTMELHPDLTQESPSAGDR